MKKLIMSIMVATLFIVSSCEKDKVDLSNVNLPSPQTKLLSNHLLDLENIEPQNFKSDSLVLLPNVKLFDDKMSKQMISYSPTKFEFIDHESLKNIEVGDILNSRPSVLVKDGFNVKVVKREIEVDKLILTVEPAGFNFFKSGKFSFNVEEDANAKDSHLKDANGLDLNINFEAEYESYEVEINGKARLEVEYNANNILTFDDDYFRMAMNLTLNSDRDNPDIMFKSGHSFEKYLPQIYLGKFIAYIPPGIYIDLTQYLEVGIEVEASTNTQSLLAGIDLSGAIGAAYVQTGFSNGVWSKWNHLNADLVVPTAQQLTGSLQLKIHAPKVKVISKPYNQGKVVFFVSAAYVHDFSVNILNDCLLSGEKYIELKAGIDCDFGPFNFESALVEEFAPVNLGNYLCDIVIDPPNDPDSPNNPYPFEFVTGQRNQTMKSGNGYFVSSENGIDWAKANRSVAADWEKFEFLYNSNGTYSIKGNNGRFLDVDRGSGGFLKFNQDDRNNPDAQFKIEKQWDGRYTLKSIGADKYVGEEWNSGVLKANKSTIGENEKFTIQRISSQPSEVWKTILQSDEYMNSNTTKFSKNGKYILKYQNDGNLAVYDLLNWNALWHTNTWGRGSFRTAMQGDGNLVVYESAWNAVWASNTAGNPGSKLQMSDKGKLRIVNPNNYIIWNN